MTVDSPMQPLPPAPKSIIELVQLANSNTIRIHKNGTVTPIAVDAQTYKTIKMLSAVTGLSVARLIAMSALSWLGYALEEVTRGNE